MTSFFGHKTSYSFVDSTKGDLQLTKVVVVGALGIGKSSLTQRLQGLPLSPPRNRDHVRTAECTLTPRPPLRFNVHVVDWSKAMEQERLTCCFSKAASVVFMFSVADPSSLDFLQEWLVTNGLRSRELLLEQARIFTIGNKCDRDGSTFPHVLTSAIEALKQKIESVYKKYVNNFTENKIIATLVDPIATEMLTERNAERLGSFRYMKAHLYCMRDMYNSGDSSPRSPTYYTK